MKVILSIDVGGTTIKSAIINEDGELVAMAGEVKSLANSDKDTIIKNFFSVIQSLILICEEKKFTPTRVAVGFPGPFDYVNGICKLKGIGKFDSLYDVNLKQVFEKRFLIPFRFANDADLYTLGVCNLTPCVQYNKLVCVCIGTGIGSGFFHRPNLVKERKGVPLDGFIYHLPFKDGILDSYLSATGLRNMIKNSGKFNDNCDVKELSELALANDENALKIFAEFGELLLEGLFPIVTDFNAECLAIGGQVARAEKLYLEPLRKKLDRAGISVEIFPNSTELALRAGCLL